MGNRVSLFRSTSTCNRNYSEKVSELPPCPTLPIREPTRSFWTFPPSAIATHHSSDDLPAHADVVVIGSGISGASFARTLLDIDHQRRDGSGPLSMVMLEAQETCSGATGRNGGHINPPLFHDYEQLKQSLGKDAAQQIIRFRLAHMDVLQEVAETEADDADCRRVHSVEVFFDEDVFAEAKRKLSIYKADMPQEASTYRIWEGEDGRMRFNLSSLAIGCITTRAGAVHPYRFVTDILLRLLEEYPKCFRLFTQTPCTGITEPTATNPFYCLTTPRGQITASHVVHLTNAWVGGLVPKLGEVVYRIRETMSAQRPGKALQFEVIGIDDEKRKHEPRSYLFYDSPEKKDFDYLTQLPDGECELMFGGGREALPETDARGKVCGPTSKGMYDVHSAAHVSGALPIYFGANNWGAEGISTADNVRGQGPWAAGRVKALWSGILSVSIDEFPWVGRIPSAISGRQSPTVTSKKSGRTRMAEPGEWVSAGYSGEGMVHAWLCSRALALMVMGLERERDLESIEGSYGVGQTVDEWLPVRYRITEARWKSARRAGIRLENNGDKVVLGGKRKIYERVQ